MRRSDLTRHGNERRGPRTSQIVFGERQHLLRVLDSLERSCLAEDRLTQERDALEHLIHARTQELNHINPVWDQKVSAVLSADVMPEKLDQLAREAPEEDFYLLRLISEHPNAPGRTLRRLSRHSYHAIRENVARHGNTDARTLGRLSRDPSHPLWCLVAFNPNAPAELRRTLRERMRKPGEPGAAK